MKEAEILKLLEGKDFISVEMSKDEFENSDGISAEDVKFIANSSIWAWAQSKKEKIKKASRISRVVRMKILDPDGFWNHFCLEEDYPRPPIRTTTEGRKLFNEWKEQNPHKGRMSAQEWQKEYINWKYPELKNEIINDDEFDITKRLNQNLNERLGYIKNIISKNNKAFFWKHPKGVVLKSYPDSLNDDYVSNIFSISNASIDRVEALLGKEDLYIDAFFDCFNHPTKSYLQIFGETSFPNDVVVHPIGEASISLGESIVDIVVDVLLALRQSRKNGQKFNTGYRSTLQSVDVPPFYFNKEELVKRRLGHE